MADAGDPLRGRRAGRGVRAGPPPGARDRDAVRRGRGRARARADGDEADGGAAVSTDREILQTHQTEEELRRHTRRIETEFRLGFETVERIDRPAVSFFGSARTGEGTRPYELARATAHRFAEAGWAVVTGGGPGVMEAANRGCREGGGLSVGFNIALPHEQGMNPYVDLGMTFHHFYARKTMFVKAAEGFCVFPGGFGTADELFESLTLIQTRKVLGFPVVLLDTEYWGPLLDWIRLRALPAGTVGEDDLALLTVTDEPEVAVRTVLDGYTRLNGPQHTPEKHDAE
ncbi:MAG: TIGR00730 family Rossman fold protein [Actinobacteria bacterium]|nr:TIGR00730 family Rossman fold protein [Actinomycetota bacterium]